MNNPDSPSSMNRREFLAMTATTAGAALAGSKLLGSDTAAAPAKPKRGEAVIAMPISTQPLFKPDLDRILEDMRVRGGVNVLMPFIYTHETHRAGVEPDFPKFRGGNYAIPHMQYYKDTSLTYEDMRATEFGDVDGLDRVVAAGKKHGIKVYPWIIEDNHCPDIPRWQPLYEVDSHGRRSTGHPAGPCKNNPGYQGYLSNLMEDYARSYDIGGFMWGAERQSGFLNALSAGDSTRPDGGGRATCFCEFCQKKAKDAGIDVARAKLGFAELEKINRARQTKQRPSDGYFSSFWRAMMNYPELLAWENLWVRGRHDLQAMLYAKVKSINPSLPIGWHIWQNVTFSPLQRAEEDYAVYGKFSDFVRPAVYNNCGGERFRAFCGNGLGVVYGDLTPEETYNTLGRQLDRHEASYDKVSAAGFSADYVQREVRRAVDGLTGTPTQVWPGIDIDVPVPAGTSICTPEGIKQALRGAFAGGATGVILSRNYIEMKPENLTAAGDALRELGVA